MPASNIHHSALPITKASEGLALLVDGVLNMCLWRGSLTIVCSIHTWWTIVADQLLGTVT